MARIDFVTGAPEQYAHLVDRLATVPDRVRSAINGASGADLASTPAGEEWPVQRILAHMAIYAHVNSVFIHRMVTMYDSQRMPFDEEAMIEEAGYLSAPPEGVLAVLEDEVGRTVRFLSETPDAAWGRRGMVRGYSRSVRQQVQAHIAHLEEHIEQVRRALT
jgi:hypothetical protein